MVRAISRRELIRRFRSLGFEGPISGGRHQFIEKGRLESTDSQPAQKRDRGRFFSQGGPAAGGNRSEPLGERLRATTSPKILAIAGLDYELRV